MSRDFVILFGVVNAAARAPTKIGLEQPLLHLLRKRGGALRKQADTTFRQDLSEIFLFIRHALLPWRVRGLAWRLTVPSDPRARFQSLRNPPRHEAAGRLEAAMHK